MKSINLDKNLILLVVLAVLFFAIYSYLPYHQFIGAKGGRIIFNSPDATGNYFFTKLFTEKNTLRYFEPLNLIAKDNIHLRGVRVINSYLVPAGFLGQILIYGLIAKLLSVNVTIFLTPFFSALAAVFFYLFLKQVFNKSIALTSSLLLFIVPAFWLYTTRSMFHNVLVIDFLIISLYFLVRTLKDQKTLYIIFSSIFLGLAIICRLSEVLWLVPIYFLILVFYWRRVKFRYLYVGFTILALFAVMIFSLNQILYGSPFATGYSQTPVAASQIEIGKAAVEKTVNNEEIKASNPIINLVKAYLLPFGFHPLRALRNLFAYYPYFFWWFFIPTLFGGLIYLVRFFQSEEKSNLTKKSMGVYLLLFISASIFLVIYYGGWQIVDRLTPEEITLGTSYVRYWLFIYVFSLPMAAFFIVETIKALNNRYFRALTVAVLVLYFTFFSVQLTFFQTDESILSIKQRIDEYYIKAERVLAITPQDSIIISERSDKIFFPERRVMSGIRNEAILSLLPGLIERVPVYYYTYWGEEDLDFWEQEVLVNFGLKLTDKHIIYGNEKLYRIEAIQ